MTALCCFSPETRRSRFLLLWLHSQYETGCLSGLHFHYEPKMGIVRAWGSTRGVPEPARWRPFRGDPVLFCLGGLTSESQASHLLALPATLIRICCESDLELPGMGPPNPGSDGLALSAASPASQNHCSASLLGWRRVPWFKITGSLHTRSVSQDALSQEVHPISWIRKHKPIPVSASSVLLSSKVACSLLSV